MSDDWRDHSRYLARPPAADDVVLDAAHLVKRALQEQVYYPEHSSRVESSLYASQHHRLVHALDMPCLVCGVRNTTLHDPTQNRHHARQMETHHMVIEWALQNAIDVAKFNAQIVQPRRAARPDDPKYARDFTEAQMKAWIDHDSDNLAVLCVTPEARVRMADGSERAIEDVCAGDRVMGHDARAHEVTETIQHPYDGVLATIDDLCLTLDHPLLTPSGWHPARSLSPGDVLYELGVRDSQMASLVGEERQVGESVVGSVPVVVVDTFARQQLAAERLLHDPAVFHRLAPALTVPIPAAHVTRVGELSRSQLCRARARLLIQTGESAGVRTELLEPVNTAHGELLAVLARECVGQSFGEATAPLGTACVGTGRIPRRVARGNDVWAPTDRAQLLNAGYAPPSGGRWRAIREVGRKHFTGTLHDLRIDGSRSFVANSVVVHNCDVHHRHSLVGIHAVSYPIWNVQSLISDDFQLTPYSLQRIEQAEERREAAENREGEPHGAQPASE